MGVTGLHKGITTRHHADIYRMVYQVNIGKQHLLGPLVQPMGIYRMTLLRSFYRPPHLHSIVEQSRGILKLF